ncbi:hypothetical protein BIFGAL_03529 [Bifidobacterium gallicum DSM 20093 = LMG 11596]|uniref:Uncharacterized protein n=1 Tax=Bifidobacterium gallicum DSM 20093 = LMG 11596 TaxID=561180 RepID=D1NUK4_9BIFI|nr:hypothetical protein BIFGAL_03529 [Bifidobacterium gallicum DSM 20093 = LMG 11596]
MGEIVGISTFSEVVVALCEGYVTIGEITGIFLTRVALYILLCESSNRLITIGY